MATRIRLRRMGANKRPFYRVVVADQRSPRDGRFIENIGKYHPLLDPSLIEIDQERALYWLGVGAQPSRQVRNLMTKVGIWDEFVKVRPSAADAERKRSRPVGKTAPTKAGPATTVPQATRATSATHTAPTTPTAEDDERSASQADADPGAEATEEGSAGA